MSFSNRTARVKDYLSTTGIGISLRMDSSRSIVVCNGAGANRSPGGGEADNDADEAQFSGISVMLMYPARRAMYNQSTTAKYASVPRITVARMSRFGAIWMKASGSEKAVAATLRAARCANPVQVLTANTGPERSREKVTAAESALNTSSPSRTANMQASESNQFNIGHTMQINPARGRKRTKARP